MFDSVILGENACFTLNLLKRVDVLRPDVVLSLPQIQKDYADIFTGIGTYEKEYHICINEQAKGVIQPPRKVPYAIRPKLKACLDKLTEQGIVADVDVPTDWVNNLVIVEKKNKTLRLCLDPKPLNAAIKRERHVIPTPADVQAQLNGNSIFSVVDMKDAYWHVKLSDESSYLTTFHTPWGRKRFLRMPFGLSSASEVMQKRNEEIFGDIPGVYVIADDLIIASSSEQQHDTIFKAVLDRTRQKGVRFNRDKIQFKVSAVQYMGNLVTHEGLKPDDKKLEAILHMTQPTDVPSLQRLLGMTKFLSQYIPNESSITAPLRLLLKKGVPWNWTANQNEAFAQLKAVLSSPPVLAFYDVTKSVTIQSDASQFGLGACLMQDNKPIAYASRSMTPAETNYAQIEKELLSIVFAVQKFHQYVYGKDAILVETDHKPIESIMHKTLDKVPPRLQRLMLKLQPYDIRIKYVPGKYMYMADTLSRAYLQVTPDDSLDEELSHVIHSLLTSLPITPTKLEEFKIATKNDSSLTTVMSLCQSGWPKSAKNVPVNARKYWNIRDELHVVDDIVFKNDSVVVPSALQEAMLTLIHESHLGMEKCKARARQLLYWPRMTLDIEDVVSNCAICSKYKKAHQREPMIPHYIPPERFVKIGIDIMTFRNVDYIVIVDYFSKYPEVVPLPDKTAQSVADQCKSIFARHGIPLEIVSDNMPFRAREFAEFLNSWGIKATTSSPGFSQSNGQVERTIQTVKSIFKKAFDDNTDPYLALLEFRNAPITGLKYSPAQILMSRRLRTKIPISRNLLKPEIVDVHDDLCARQIRQKVYFDRGTKPLPNLKKGDKVRYKTQNRWNDGIICDITNEPRSYLVRNANGCVRRNRRHLCKMPNSYIANYDYLFESVSDILPAQSSPAHVIPSQRRTPTQRVSSFGRRIRSPQRFVP